MKTWLDYLHPDYEAAQARRTVARDMYSGVVLDKLTTYLIQHSQGEFDAAYEERRKIADYTNHMAMVVDGLAGMLFAVNDQTERDFGALGDITDADTTASRLWFDADGEGGNWETIWQQLATQLIVQNEYWLLVDGITEDREARIVLIEPERVQNWVEEDGQPVEVRVTELVDVRSDVRDKRDPQEQHVVYTLDGWERWIKDDKEQPLLVEEGAYEFYATTARIRRTLPLVRVRLPLARHVGWLIAKKCQAIFNMESSRDFKLWASNFIRLCIDSTADYQEILAKLREGFSVLKGTGHKYISPDPATVTVATEVIEKKIRDFRQMAMREYGDAARERTATEIRQEFRAGVEAFLALLKTALDEAERNVLWRLEQVYYPEQPSRWGEAFVNRTDTFLPEHTSSSERAAIARQWIDAGFNRKVALMLAGYSEEEAERIIETDAEAVGVATLER